MEEIKRNLQRSISSKYEASKKRTGRYEKTRNIMKEEAKLRRASERLTNIRQDCIHQTTHKLISMLPSGICMENLDVVGMIKKSTHKKAKAISDAKWSEFLRQMKYKCEYYNIPFMQVDRYYASSKTCSNCGAVKKNLTEKDRVYVCPECGLIIDRDYNAAINLMKHVTTSKLVAA